MFCRTIVYVWRNYFLINCCSALRFAFCLISLVFGLASFCLLPSTPTMATTTTIAILVVNSQSISFDSIPFHTIRYLPRTTKWYTTIKQFKFISVCDQFYAQVSHFDFSSKVCLQFSSYYCYYYYIFTRSTPNVSVCPGIFIADFPSICAPIVFTHPHGIFHFEISCVKWCISLRTQYVCLLLATHES